MTPEKQRSEIAKLCDWKPDLICTDLNGNPWPSDPPDYLNDLNACYEFTAHMTYDQQVEFAEILHSIVLKSLYRAWWNPTAPQTFQLLNASAAQRCEAFLRVFNKWEETPCSPT